MTARLRLCEPSEIARLLPRALAGEVVLAPVADDATAQLIDTSMPVTEPDAAVIVTTSGSTGTPKQVVLSASAIKASAAAFRQRFGSFSWTCILGPQHVAGLMVHARDLLDRPYDQGRTAISIVPTQLVRALRDRSSAAELASFDAVLVGGAALNPMLLGRARQAGIRVLTSYGMSETCGGVAFDGSPLPGVQITIADDERITIGGPMLFSGYRMDPQATAHALVGGRLLTQDRGEWATADDGRTLLRVLGRLDDVIVSGGVNVDLAELQRVLDMHIGRPAAVFGVPDAEWGTRVVLATTSRETTLAEWREELRRYLAPAALPKQLLVVASFPRTASGKLDRQQLVDRACE